VRSNRHHLRNLLTSPSGRAAGGEGAPVRVLLATLLLALLLMPSAAAQLRIGVATMQPGEIFFERFGHNALIVDDPAQGVPMAYNFGYFDMNEPGFALNFIRGRMQYYLVALPLAQDLAYYREVGRGVSIQWLNLDEPAARALATALADNARPEHARYAYDYFTANCSTQVRDALDQALGGALKRQLQTRSRGNTYRSEAVRLASPVPWMWLGFDLLLGPAADRPNALWQDAFVPMQLAAALADSTGAGGRALVSDTLELLPHRLPPEPPESRRAWWLWLLAGLLTGCCIMVVGRHHPRRVAAIALPFWALGGALGVLMLYLWFGTAHVYGWANQNLWLFSPLCLLLLPGGWNLARRRTAGRLFNWLLASIALMALIALFVYWLSALPQRNLHWITLLLPIHAALWRRLGWN